VEGSEGERGGEFWFQALVHGGTTSGKNGVGILIDRSFKDGVVDVKR
jgi:hypothetical protein